MNVLALDLGTKTGWAFGSGAGTWNLATADEVTAWGKDRETRRLDPRPIRLFKRLTQAVENNESKYPDAVVFEDVEFSTYTLQCQLWSSLRTAVWFWCYYNEVHADCVNVSALKKFATGHGGATKAMMLSSLKRRFPGREKGLDDNAIDALWVKVWAETALARMPKRL